MKIVWRFLLGGLVGYGAAYVILHFRDMNQSEYIFLYTVLAVVVGLMIWSIKLFQEVKTLHHSSFTGDEEDEADRIKYQKTSDFSICTNSAMILSLITVAVALVQQTSLMLIIVALVIFIGSVTVGLLMNRMAKYLYPERELPKADATTSGDDYLDQILEVSDDGEKMVILQGLFKSHHLMSMLLILGILLATTYSAVGENSQLFSIFFMGAILIVGQVKYQRAIRNK